MYDYADKILEFLRKKYIRIFGKARNYMVIDELNAMQYANDMFSELLELTLFWWLKVANKAYGDICGEKDHFDRDWIEEYLLEYDPITKYVFTHEVDRKASRFGEMLVATKSISRDVDGSLRLWYNMIAQYTISIVDEATEQAYLDSGVTKLRWNTERDERVCKVCQSRDRRIYRIDLYPEKPHYGCRCYPTPVGDD